MIAHPLSATADRLVVALGPFARARTVCSACSSGANAFAIGAAWLALGEVGRGARRRHRRPVPADVHGLQRARGDRSRPVPARSTCAAGVYHRRGRGLLRARASSRGPGARRTLRRRRRRRGRHERGAPHHQPRRGRRDARRGRAPRARLGRSARRAGRLRQRARHGHAAQRRDGDPRARHGARPARRARVGLLHQGRHRSHARRGGRARGDLHRARACATGASHRRWGSSRSTRSARRCATSSRGSAPTSNVALSDSFGFGGVDTVLALARADRVDALAVSRRSVYVSGLGSASRLGALSGLENLALLGEAGAPVDPLVGARPGEEPALRSSRAARDGGRSRLAGAVRADDGVPRHRVRRPGRQRGVPRAACSRRARASPHRPTSSPTSCRPRPRGTPRSTSACRGR